MGLVVVVVETEMEVKVVQVVIMEVKVLRLKAHNPLRLVEILEEVETVAGINTVAVEH